MKKNIDEIIREKFTFENDSNIVEAFCRAYLETDHLEFAIYAISMMKTVIEGEE